LGFAATIGRSPGPRRGRGEREALPLGVS